MRNSRITKKRLVFVAALVVLGGCGTRIPYGTNTFDGSGNPVGGPFVPPIPTSNSAPTLAGVQSGTVSIDGSGKWQSVSFTAPFNNTPAVVATLNSLSSGATPCAVVIQSITMQGFSFLCANVQSTEDIHRTNDMVAWIAAEIPAAGDNAPYQAGSVTIDGSANFQTVNFSQSFSSQPQVFGSLTSLQGEPCSVGVNQITSSSFNVVCNNVSGDGYHTLPDTMSYIALEGLESGQSGNVTIDGTTQTVKFPAPLNSTPKVTASLNSLAAGDSACTPIILNVSPAGFQFYCFNPPPYPAPNPNPGGAVHSGADTLSWLIAP